MKRLNGWDALLLSSETPNVHQHTLKVAIVDTAEFAGEPTFDRFCEILRGRLHLLEPLRYQLVDIPFHLHRPMWLEEADLDFDYHVRRVTVPAPGGRRARAVFGAQLSAFVIYDQPQREAAQRLGLPVENPAP